VASEAILRARWIEAVTIHLKKMGLSFDAISEQITRFGRGQAQSIVAIPEGVKFGRTTRSVAKRATRPLRRRLLANPRLQLMSCENSTTPVARSCSSIFSLRSAKEIHAQSKSA